MSVTQTLLNNLATYTANVKKVVLNDTIEITNFEQKEAVESQVFIEYAIKKDLLPRGTITNIKIVNESEEIIGESDVYIPVATDTVINHVLTIKEGE